jgi:hypothetical protein
VKHTKSGTQKMVEKLADNRRDEGKLMKERDNLRMEFEEMVPEYAYNRIMKKLKMKVQSRRLELKIKNKNKISRYKEEKDMENLEKLSNLQEEMGVGQLKIFQGISIQPEERKPPVLSKEVTLSKYEMEVLSKNQKYAVRAMMNKEKFMVELEKGLCKKVYSDIGKEVVNGKTVEEEPMDAEDKRVMEESEWQGRKSELVYDFEFRDLDFGRQKATNMKNNKRITLPKSKDVQLEAYMEVRRKRAVKLYDMSRSWGRILRRARTTSLLGRREG